MTMDDSTRRKFLQATAGAGVIGVAGCIGDDVDPDEDPLDDDDGDDMDADDDNGDPDEDAEWHMDVGTSAGGTTDVGLAIAQGVADHSDELSYSTIESPGYVGTVYRMAEDAFEAGWTDPNSMNKAQTDVDTFEEESVDQLPWFGFDVFPYVIYVMAIEGTGIETFDDLAGASVYPAEPGYSTRATSLDVWEQDPVADVFEEMDIVDADVADAPGLMEEGQIDAAIAYGTPGVGNTGWVVEYDARVDVNYVQHTDALVEAIEMFPGAALVEHEDPVETFLWDQDIGADEIVGWSLNPGIHFHPETEDEAVYELCRVAHEHGEDIQQIEERYSVIEPEDMLGGALEDYPFHPGAAEYYQDVGVWDDDWIIGDRDQIGEYKR